MQLKTGRNVVWTPLPDDKFMAEAFRLKSGLRERSVQCSTLEIDNVT